MRTHIERQLPHTKSGSDVVNKNLRNCIIIVVAAVHVVVPRPPTSAIGAIGVPLRIHM